MTTNPFHTPDMPTGSASQSARQWAKTAPLATHEAAFVASASALVRPSTPAPATMTFSAGVIVP